MVWLMDQRVLASHEDSQPLAVVVFSGLHKQDDSTLTVFIDVMTAWVARHRYDLVPGAHKQHAILMSSLLVMTTS